LRWKVLRIAGATPLSRGLWPKRSWRLEEDRLSEGSKAGRARDATGAPEARSEARRGEENAPPSSVLSPAEASRGVVKRRSVQGRSTARETREARVFVVNVLGSRRRSDASRVARHGEPQGKPGMRASLGEAATPLVRVTVERRRNGAPKSRRIIPTTRDESFSGGEHAKATHSTKRSRHGERHLGGRAASSRGFPSVGNARRPRLIR
jgi:hypothetical protein